MRARDKRSPREGRGEIPHVEERTDTKGRQQPAKKKRPADAEQEEADKAECLSLWEKVQQAEKEAGAVNRERGERDQAPAPIKIEPSRKMKRLQALQVVDFLLDHEILALVLKIVEGERQSRFADVRDAVSRLYADLMKVGR
jgi:hypothetical protein